MEETTDELIAAKALIANKRNWLRGQRHSVSGLAGGGGPIVLTERFCAEGALEHVKASPAAWNRLFAQVPRAFGSIAEFNDHSEHEDVLGAFDRAIRSGV